MASSPEDTGSPEDTVRWPFVARIGVVLAVLTVVVGIGAALVAAFVVDRDDDEASRIIEDAVAPVAPIAVGDGSFLYAERTTGRVVQADADGVTETFATVPDELRTDGQRGLLGIVTRQAMGATELYATWTRASDDRLVVGRLAPRTPELVWEGPVSADFANGGTVVFRGDELLIGIGELQDPDAVDDPDTPNGKILILDPAGPPDQEPGVVLGGWHNPFALTVVGGDVWLVDNAPGSDPERVVRIAPDGTSSMLELEGKRAPSSLALLADGDLALCGFVSEVVERLPVPDEGVEAPAGELGPPCATGVAVLADDRVVTTTTDAVWQQDVAD